MSSKSIHCRLITPDACVLDEPITYASIPAWDGSFGVLLGRAPIVAKLGVGELRMHFPDAEAKGGERSYVVDDGFFHIVHGKLTILASRAVAAEELTVQEAESDLAKVSVEHAEGMTPEAAAQRSKLARDRAFAQAKVRVAKRVRGHGI